MMAPTDGSDRLRPPRSPARSSPGRSRRPLEGELRRQGKRRLAPLLWWAGWLANHAPVRLALCSQKPLTNRLVWVLPLPFGMAILNSGRTRYGWGIGGFLR